jgi:TonB family protein
MMDPVTAALVHRQRLEPGVVTGAWFAVVGHLLLLCTLLIASARPAQQVWKVVPVTPLPVGELTGGFTPARIGNPDLTPTVVHKPPTAAPAKGLALPSKVVARESKPVIRSTGGADLDAGPGQASAVTLGDPLGDTSPHSWYLAGVRSKIWTVWVAQIRGNAADAPEVEFTILADGSLASVELVHSSGDRLLDMAAKRAVYTASPFAPIPRDAERNEIRVRAIFRPAS